MSKWIENLYIKNAKLYFRNFAGNPDKYNPNGGIRYFGVIIDEDKVEPLRAEGWKIKDSTPSETDGSFVSYLKVKVVYGKRSPSILLINGNNSDDRNVLNEKTVDILDHIRIQQAKLNIRPYKYNFNGLQGISARLESAAFTMVPDPIIDEYGMIIPEA
nr:MAG TPA: hypothetical protein [Siphoviridae sp. ct7JV2]